MNELPKHGSRSDDLARLVEDNGDEAEAAGEYYEAAADPTNIQNEQDQRRYRGMYPRRLRHLMSRRRDRE